jgi:hypothetical protein
MNYSITVAGAIAMLLSFLADQFNVKLPYTNEEVKNAIITIIGVGGFLVTLYGRYRHGDINIFGFKKPAPQLEVNVSPSHYDDLE